MVKLVGSIGLSRSLATQSPPFLPPFYLVAMTLPIVAIIGRPNVGKSTLVNRLAGAQTAIVYDQPGITRDRTYQPAFWRDRDYQVVDTGGLVFNDDSEFLPHIREQAQLALAEAQAAVLVVDGQAGPTEGDREIASWLRQAAGARTISGEQV
jgi:GTP-binding protein